MSDMTTFNALVDDRIQDTEGVLTSTQIDAAVSEAVRTYQRHRPHTVVEDLAGADDYDVALPSAWSDQFSDLTCVEYPAGQRVPQLLDAEAYFLYQSPSATVIRFLATTPATGQSVRVTFTAPHTVDADSSTIPAADEECLGNLAAAVACEWISSHYSQQGDPTLSADTTDHHSKASNYALRAKRFRALAYEHLGIATTSRTGTAAASPVAAASATRDWDSDLSNGRGDRLTHPRRYR